MWTSGCEHWLVCSADTAPSCLLICSQNSSLPLSKLFFTSCQQNLRWDWLFMLCIFSTISRNSLTCIYTDTRALKCSIWDNSFKRSFVLLGYYHYTQNIVRLNISKCPLTPAWGQFAGFFSQRDLFHLSPVTPELGECVLTFKNITRSCCSNGHSEGRGAINPTVSVQYVQGNLW